jgi:energy-coupling factor transport system substrate-specific component
MTWQMASFGLLVIALTAGFTWYERAHPTAKVLALVATLAALAALGRVAFAPLPNVKPTTDIVLLSGYVLGAAPGFVVGAVAALASNFFFGQGPYTPWQMAGWGAVGVFGALLAAGFGRDLGRWPLAVACGLAGLAYGVWMDVHLWVMYTGHTLGELGVLSARSVPFNVAHVAGNVVFCVAFGPVLVRALRRFRDRFEITWRPLPAASAALAALVLVLVPAAPADAADRWVTRGASYLKQAQTRDGGFAEARGRRASNAIHSGWAVIGLAAARRDPGRAAARYLRRQAARVRDVGDMERTILALRAAGLPTRELAVRLERRRARNGSWESLVNRTAFGVMALRAAGRRVPERTLRWLRAQQNGDGGWGVGGRGSASGIDDTSAVVMALGRGGEEVDRAVRWLAARQAPDGGFPLAPGAPSNAQSTSFVVQALVAAGRDPDEIERDGSRTPIEYLRSLQAPDGSIRYSRTSRQTPTWVTAQAVAALARKPLPVRPVRRTRAKPVKPTGLRVFVAAMLGALL